MGLPFSVQEIWEAQFLTPPDPEVEEWIEKITTEALSVVLKDPARTFICFEPWSDIGKALYNNKVQKRLIMLGFKIERFDYLRRSDYYPDPCGEYWVGISWDIKLPDI